MRGLLSWGSYLPYWRLDRTSIAAVAGTGGGKGTRTVAGYDENSTTMAVAAAFGALDEGVARPSTLWLATTEPAYLDKTNAAAVHAALRLDRSVGAYDAVGSARGALGALRAGLESTGPALVVAADLRGGLPGGPDESLGGDAAAALLVGSDADGPVVAELLGWTSVTEEFLDRWRAPGASASSLWEERFGLTRYTELGTEALKIALQQAGVGPEEVSTLIVAGPHDRAAQAVARAVGVPVARLADRLGEKVGNAGAAQAGLLLAAELEKSVPDRIVVLLSLVDGADVAVFRTTPALGAHRVARTVVQQLAIGSSIAYGRYLAWRGLLPVEPPRRPEPARPSASAAWRNTEWKFAFVGSVSSDDILRLPPSPMDDIRAPMASALGTIVTYTVDRLAYSPSPPVVFAVIDFDGGGRLPLELTDVEEGELAIGGRVEMTFRRLFTAEGVHNYFWKARPVRNVITEED